MKRITASALWVTAISILSCQPSNATTYAMRQLDTPEGQISWAYAINDRGEAAGTIQGGQYLPSRAVCWSHYGVSQLTTVEDSWAYDINDSGQVLGLFYDEMGYSHTFLWHADTGMTDLGSSVGGPYGTAYSMNDSAQIVGYSLFFSDPDLRLDHIEAFVWSHDVGTRYLGTFGGRNSEAVDINDAGQVVGRADTPDGKEHAFLWSDGMGMIDITPNSSGSGADAINDTGQVVGWSHIDAEHYEVFLWSSEHGMRTIATYSNDIGIRPRAINDHGVVVGSLADVDGSEKAFVWSNDTGFTILGDGIAYDVNDSGQIAGVMYGLGGGYGAVLWEPVPEPSSLAALLALSLLAAGSAVRKRMR